MRKNFSLYTHIPIHDEPFLYTHTLKLFLFTSTRSIYKPYSCSKISFFRFSQHTHVVYTKVSLYTLVAHTHKNFFSHIIYTHKILLYTFPFYIYIKNLFLFFIYIDMTFIHNNSFLFLALSRFWFILFFRTTFLNEKLYTVPEFQQTLLTINEVSTNVIVQMTCMHKTRVNQNETNISPSVIQNKMIRNR